MSDERIDREIRRALATEAERVEVPADLADRTIEAVEAARPGRLERLRARRDARRAHGRVTGYPRWAYAGAAAAAMAALFVVGTVVTGDIEAPDLPGVAQFGEPADGEADERVEGTAGIQERQMRGEREDLSAPDPVEVAPQTGDAPAPDVDAGPPPEPLPPPRVVPDELPQLVRTAELEVEIEDGTFDGAWAQANEIPTRHGGFVTSSSTERREGRIARGTMTIRVPVENLDAALADLRGLGTLARMQTEGFDVSGQIVDLDARIRSAQAQEARLLELLDAAQNVSDVLEIRERLDSVREQIERLDGRRGQLQQQVDLATIETTVFEEQTDEGSGGGDGRFDDAWRTAVETALTIFAGLVVVLGFVLPFALIGFLLWLAVTLVRRRTAE